MIDELRSILRERLDLIDVIKYKSDLIKRTKSPSIAKKYRAEQTVLKRRYNDIMNKIKLLFLSKEIVDGGWHPSFDLQQELDNLPAQLNIEQIVRQPNLPKL